ncbi:MAG: hypothetical protein K2Y21_04940 [Phycisphaerales bacterium]|nr:hypothetical protein [Phycisphaerales bacterium]
MWQGFDAATVLGAALERREKMLREEQSVRGLDAMREVELQQVLGAGCEAAGYGVLREVGYPTLSEQVSSRAARLRCDLVLTPAPGQKLQDALTLRREKAEVAGTLFAEASSPAAPSGGGAEVKASECLWVEVKTVAQFTYTHGVPVPNRGYGSELTAALRTDLDKLSRDEAILDGCVVLVLFTLDERTARNDVVAAANRCLDHASAIASMSSRSFAITDRAGNACCTVATFDVLQ